MKKLLPLFALVLIAGSSAAEAQAYLAHDGAALIRVRDDRDRDRNRDRGGGDRREERNYSIDEAINLVESRTGGRYISGSKTGASTFMIKVQIGPNIVTYRVDLASRSMSKM